MELVSLDTNDLTKCHDAQYDVSDVTSSRTGQTSTLHASV